MLRYLLLASIISSCIFFFRLGSNQLQSWDEAIYAESAKEMLVTGDYLTPHWNQEKFFQKPPLAMWATAGLFKIFGVNETSARAFSALCGVGCVLLTMLIGRLFLSESLSFMAGLILLVTPHFNYHARQGGLDVPLILFMLLGLYAYLKAQVDARWWLLFGLGAALAIMTKGPGAAALLVAVGVSLVVRRSQVWKSGYFWMGLGALVILGSAWHLAMVYLYGNQFLREYFGQQILARSAGVVDTTPHGWTFYLRTLFFGLLPYTFLLPFAIVRVWKSREFPAVLTIFAITVLVICTAVATKQAWYILPVYPVLALAFASLNPSPSRVFLPLFLLAIVHCVILDRKIPLLNPEQPEIISKAQTGTGPFETDIHYAPAVLFYSNRKICAAAPDHTMGQMTKCSN